MPARKFRHSFFSPDYRRENLIIELTTEEIAAAAVEEILQIGLSASPFNLFVEQLLTEDEEWFKWKAKLGNVRETRTALSGLFGRFVARAYLTRYHDYHHFEPIASDTQSLAGWPYIEVRRAEGVVGDLPDWIVSSRRDANDFAIAEAKGSHNKSGFNDALASAKAQVRRINVHAGETILATKRYAIATRWAVDDIVRLEEPWLAVDDPEEGERPPTDDEYRYIQRSIELGHFAALAEGMGLRETGAALREAKTQKPGNFDIPEGELVSLGEGREAVVAVAVCPTGIIPIPRSGDLGDFQAALSTVYAEQVLFFVVPARVLVAADSIGNPIIVPDQPQSQGKLWSEERFGGDGSVIVPGIRASLSRWTRRSSSP